MKRNRGWSRLLTSERKENFASDFNSSNSTDPLPNHTVNREQNVSQPLLCNAQLPLTPLSVIVIDHPLHGLKSPSATSRQKREKILYTLLVLGGERNTGKK